MALREIRTDGDPILRKKSRIVETVDDKIEELIADMVETMRDAEGIGLAAPQIGVLKRIIVVEYEDKLYKMINPVIKEEVGKIKDVEGCLSVPGYSGLVERPESLVVEFLDEKAKYNKITANGYLARVFCHEIDHLEGILYTDLAEKIMKSANEEDSEEI